MEKQNRKPGNGLYACVALLVLAVLTVTVVTLVSSISRRARNEDAPPNVSDTAGGTTAPAKPPIVTKPPVAKPDTASPSTSAPAPVTEAPVAATDAPAAEVIAPPDEDVEAIRADEPLVFMQPVAGHVVKFHDLDMLVYSLTMNDWRTHNGIDISATAGSEVFACADGKIESIYTDPLMGECVCIDHGDGLKSYYKNLSGNLPFDIVEGAEVKAGACIGGVGDSSMIELADVNHLHFEMSLGGISVDPLGYLPYEIVTQE